MFFLLHFLFPTILPPPPFRAPEAAEDVRLDPRVVQTCLWAVFCLANPVLRERDSLSPLPWSSAAAAEEERLARDELLETRPSESAARSRDPPLREPPLPVGAIRKSTWRDEDTGERSVSDSSSSESELSEGPDAGDRRARARNGDGDGDGDGGTSSLTTLSSRISDSPIHAEALCLLLQHCERTIRLACEQRTHTAEVLLTLTQLQTLRLSPSQQKLPIFRALHSTQACLVRADIPGSGSSSSSGGDGKQSRDQSSDDPPGGGGDPDLSQLTRERLHLLWLYPSLVKCVGLEDPAIRSELQIVLTLVGECLGLQ